VDRAAGHEQSASIASETTAGRRHIERSPICRLIVAAVSTAVTGQSAKEEIAESSFSPAIAMASSVMPALDAR